MRTLLAVLALGACVTPYSGPRLATFDPAQAKAVDLIAVGGARAVCPNGPPPQLKAVITLTDGRRLETWQSGESQEGRLGFDAFEWSASPGSVNQSGLLVLPPDPFALVDRTIAVTARVAGKPELESQLELTTRWDCGGHADARGPAGQSGQSGWSGSSGAAGRSGDATNAAGDGSPGEHGQDGGDGGPGQPGPAVEVALALVATQASGQLVLVRVGSAHFLFDPKGEKFHVAADGGGGGSGGSGGSGGAGGPGGSNSVQGGGDGGRGGDGGNGGNGGRGGDGADGGSIHVRHDRRHPELLDRVTYSNGGGPGGSGGNGGFAGSAGSGGSSASGRKGVDGRAGQSGQSGSTGRSGRGGGPAEVQAADVRALFAEEIERGLPIAID
jgi:hypothetical protein